MDAKPHPAGGKIASWYKNPLRASLFLPYFTCPGLSVRKQNVYLIGPMGSGKTTIGRQTAELLELQFFDCDAELELRTGVSVSIIFDIEGEEGFRERETRLLEELSVQKNCLIATGGGSILRRENRKIMRRSGLVVYLQTSVAQQLARLRLDKQRPLLQDGDRERRLTALAAVRDPIYESASDFTFPSQNRSVPLAAKRLSRAILSYWNEPRPTGISEP
jgi:shikimate kinase